MSPAAIDQRKAPRWRGYARGPRAALAIALALLGAALLVHHLLQVDWAAMRGAMARMPGEALLGATLLTAASYGAYCSFDLLGRRATGHHLDAARVLGIGFVSHACALSLGPFGAGVRFRLATRHGLPAHLTAALWLFNISSNWLGFALLAGGGLVARTLTLPSSWGIGRMAPQLAGLALLALVAAYLATCVAGRRWAWRWRGVAFRAPSWPVALLQCAVSALNWLLIAGVIQVLLPSDTPFDDVLGALMASALALAVIDVPAGLGVTETVFLTLLGSRVAPSDLLAALVAYRAIYFVLPLLVASVVYLALEWDALSAVRSPGARSPALRPGAPPPRQRPPPTGWRRSRP